jgi:hypothetical protein
MKGFFSHGFKLVAVLIASACASSDAPVVQLVVDPVPMSHQEAEHLHFFADLLPDPEDLGTTDVGMAAQALSFFGREDLAAELKYSEYSETDCLLVGEPFDPLAEIERGAKKTSIVMIGESHTRSSTRSLIEDVAVRLAPMGYNYFAAEAFGSAPVRDDGLPPSTPVDDHADEPFFRRSQGAYTDEAQFGRLLRTVKSLGYRLVAYEYIEPDNEPALTDGANRINRRDAGQTENLMRAVFRRDPGAKVLIHVGYRHGAETPQGDPANPTLWLGYRLKQATGIDPFTIDQTSCRHRGGSLRQVQTGSTAHDLVLSRPVETFERRRPSFRYDRGDLPTVIPSELVPNGVGWRIILAEAVDEPDAAVPMDMVAIRRGEEVVLMLPPGRFRLRSYDVPL